jgi:hypothetical protein
VEILNERLTNTDSKYKQYSAKQTIITAGLQVDYTYSNDSYVSSQFTSRTAVMRVAGFVNHIVSKVSNTWQSATSWLRGGAKNTTPTPVPKPKLTSAKTLEASMDRRTVGRSRGMADLSTSM